MKLKSVIKSEEIWAQIIWQIEFITGVINGKNFKSHLS
jgi:hypothetical protein